jgi:D-alanyl-D-alanine carboxypeptidase/D-alanyl-D-alanine-endopeptidase (penicillin-binding protein 4)
MRRVLILAVLLPALALADLPPGLARLTASEGMRHATIAVYAAYVTEGTRLLAYNENLMLVPGSTQKLLVSAAALDLLGEDYVFETKMTARWGQGVAPALTLVGGGDPILTHDDVAAMVSGLRAKGLPASCSATLDLSRYDGERYGPGWQLDDLGYYYQPPVQALAIGANRIDLYAAPDASGGPWLLRLDPPVDFLTLERVAGPGEKPEAVRDVDRDHVTVTVPPGWRPDGKELIQGLAPTCVETLARWSVSKALADAPPPTAPAVAAEVAVTHYSKPLSSIIRRMNKESDNLIAEMLLKELGYKATDLGSFGTGTKALDGFLKKAGCEMSGVSVGDGSGLSRYNAITPRNVVALLRYAAVQDWFQAYLTSLPMPGTDGTLKSRLIGLKGRVHAKTGSLHRSTALAGYLRARSGKLVAFSIIVNHAEISDARTFEDAVVKWLHDDREAARKTGD